jgi:hypothetical protein
MYKRLIVGGLLVLIIGICILFSSRARVADASVASNWPQWRGPDGQGVSNEKNLPFEWNQTKNVLWRTSIPGRGFSSPIVWNNRIFLTTSIEGEQAPAEH